MTKVPGQHTRGCIDFAASRAWQNDSQIEAYPSDEATRAGLAYLDAAFVDCRCDEWPECRHGWQSDEAIEDCRQGRHDWMDTA